MKQFRIYLESGDFYTIEGKCMIHCKETGQVFIHNQNIFSIASLVAVIPATALVYETKTP